jgi:hypothetical protein
MPLALVSTGWQKALPVLIPVCIAAWVALFRDNPMSTSSLFFVLLIVYMVHQIEEHLWPGGFRQFANAHVFKSGDDDWPIEMGGVALVNIGWVWLPIGAAALMPNALYWVGLGWVGLTLVNAISHIATSFRFRVYNPGLITSVVLFLPFTIWFLAMEHARGALSGADIALAIVLGVVLHFPVAALFVVPFVRARHHRPVAG